MLFHPEKCKFMSIGKNSNVVAPFYLTLVNDDQTRHLLFETDAEKDLGVTTKNDLKFDVHVNRAANKASPVLGQLKRTFRFWTMSNFLLLYTSYVRPHLEYAAPAWCPYNKRDIKTIERYRGWLQN